ncbi:alanine racemase [Branchiibius sp. NY16-3462-2]|uniref:alanine racemase n=1 Tax=Branchiibius sp. NY16-3462-2 TaxID=1807500 RepID=UPI0007972D57|nr:alanine racemase [Branchiibius sp. NY16-3462-2]KYH45310.1 alanine racemase [Branchiibius sp. NY16-3462-2]
MTGQPPGDATARITVDLDAIRHNAGVLKRRAGDAELMAVVKGDAYGHGLIPVANAALDGGATWLGVAQLREALQLRDAGISAPVLSWLHAPGADFDAAVAADVQVAVPHSWEIEAVADAARRAGKPATVHLKVDTGLARNGAYGPQWPELLTAAAKLQAEGVVDVAGVMTHFIFADSPQHPSVLAQQEAFAQAVQDAEDAGLDLRVRHMANSAATLTGSNVAWDMVRPGIALYGLSPVPDIGSSRDFDLVPAMTVDANVTITKRVPAGQGVSYGHTYVTSRETTLVDVPIGYSDGIPRAASSNGPVQIGGQRFTVSGRVCMDQFVVDVGDLPVAEGDRVVLFGTGENGEPTAQDWADAAGTISYEIVGRMSGRLPRIYRGQS